jgi:hypothetical protein
VATVLIPIPSRDFDPTEVAVSWKVLKRLGHSVVFATPAGREGSADDIMLTGEGLTSGDSCPDCDAWSRSAGWRGRMRTHGGPMRRCGSIRRSRPRLPGGSWVSKASTACCSPAAIARGECANTRKQCLADAGRPILRGRLAGGGDLPWRFARRAQQHRRWRALRLVWPPDHRAHLGA